MTKNLVTLVLCLALPAVGCTGGSGDTGGGTSGGGSVGDGGGQGTPTPPGTPDIPLPANPRIAEINFDAFGGQMSNTEFDEVSNRIFGLIDQSRSANVAAISARDRADQIVAVVGNQPGVFRAVRTATNDVVIQFRDGTPYVHFVGSTHSQARPYALNQVASRLRVTQPGLKPKAMTAPAVSTIGVIPGGVDSPGGPHPDRQSTALPTGNKAVLINIENIGDNVQGDLDQMLTKRGYKVLSSAGTLESFETEMLNVDVAWIATHGTYGNLRVNPTDPEVSFYVFSSNTPRTGKCEDDPMCDKRRRQIKAMQIIGTGADSSSVRHWGFTLNFILDNFGFNPGSFFFLGSCSSMLNSPEIAALKSGLKIRGLGALMGWDITVWDEGNSNSSKFVFDLILGGNNFTNLSPKQRPFSIDAVFDYLVQTGQDLEKVSNQASARLKFLRFADRPVALVPSTLAVVPDENTQQGFIYGEFGNRPRDEYRAELDGSPLNLVDVNPGRIVVELPTQQLSGQIQVYAGKRQANQVPLTLWQGQFSQRILFGNCGGLFGAPGIMFEAVCNPMRFRADVHGYRLKPGGPIFGRSAPQGSDSKVQLQDQVKDTQCESQVTGESVIPQQTKVTPKGVPNRALPWIHNTNTSDQPWNFILGEVDIDARNLKLLFNYNAPFDNDLYSWDDGNKAWVKAADWPLAGFPNILGMASQRIALDNVFSMVPATNVPVAIPSAAGPLAGCAFDYSGSLKAFAAPDGNTEH